MGGSLLAIRPWHASWSRIFARLVTFQRHKRHGVISVIDLDRTLDVDRTYGNYTKVSDDFKTFVDR